MSKKILPQLCGGPVWNAKSSGALATALGARLYTWQKRVEELTPLCAGRRL